MHYFDYFTYLKEKFSNHFVKECLVIYYLTSFVHF